MGNHHPARAANCGGEVVSETDKPKVKLIIPITLKQQLAKTSAAAACALLLTANAWAQNEIERYTYRIPGQATAYYFGYMKLQALRTQTELASQ